MTPHLLLQLRNLTREFTAPGGGVFTAVDRVNLKVIAGESIAIVGESGSGKSTLGRLALALIKPTTGSVLFEGQDLARLDAGSMRALRRHMQVVFQNPHTSLHPRMTVAQSLAEPLRIQGGSTAAAIRARVAEMVDIVGMPRAFLNRYPHELSGGQKQRICIARALILRPKLIVLDEPTSALDVSVQAQILDFLQTMQREWSLSYLFISHNLAVVQAMCSSVLVMYQGQVVERGPVAEVMNRPRHPYTQRLLLATLAPTPDATIPSFDDGMLTGLLFKGGCRYVQRCPAAMKDRCEHEAPDSRLLDDDVEVRCHLHSSDSMPVMGGATIASRGAR